MVGRHETKGARAKLNIGGMSRKGSVSLVNPKWMRAANSKQNLIFGITSFQNLSVGEINCDDVVVGDNHIIGAEMIIVEDHISGIT